MTDKPGLVPPYGGLPESPRAHAGAPEETTVETSGARRDKPSGEDVRAPEGGRLNARSTRAVLQISNTKLTQCRRGVGTNVQVSSEATNGTVVPTLRVGTTKENLHPPTPETSPGNRHATEASLRDAPTDGALRAPSVGVRLHAPESLRDSSHAAHPRCFCASGAGRNIGELQALPFVPKLHLPGVYTPMLAVRVPTAPLPHAAAPDAVCMYLGTLWATARRQLDGVEDKRAYSLMHGRGGMRKVAMEYWTACTEHTVAPAQWLAWRLGWWAKDKSGQPPVRLMLSGKLVGQGKLRRMFRLMAPRLGGAVVYDPLGRALLRRHAALVRELDQLVAYSFGHATDAEVEAVVLRLFPRGAANAARLLAHVHQQCTTETARLAGEVARGEYIWGSNGGAAQ